ncbi:MAG TPA: hypothetical protein V6D20_18770 [Candidatus Obscuribacterales bacterium]
MTQLLVQLIMGLGLTGGMAIAAILPVQAQQSDIPVTGGRLILNDTSIFVPGAIVNLPTGERGFLLPDGSVVTGTPGNFNTDDPRTFVYDGTVSDSLLIRTRQGTIPLNAMFQVSTFPVLSTTPNGVPAIGDTGSVLGTLTFRGFTAAGEPAFFNNIPTELEFQVTALTPSSEVLRAGAANGDISIANPTTEYRTLPTVLTESGSVDTSGGSFNVGRSTAVVFVQHQPNDPVTGDRVAPVDFPGLGADAFNIERFGITYAADIETNLTGGSVTVSDPPGFGTTGNTPALPPSVVFTQPVITIVPQFTPGIWNPTNPFLGGSQFTPVLPDIFGVVFVFVSVPSGLVFDPPILASADQSSVGFEFEMTPRPVPIGLASRVFPGMSGERMRNDSIFTAITEFPEHVNVRDRFTVIVEGRNLGEFSPGDTVVFSDYADQLGDLLIDGQGVTRFVIGGIEPSTDLSDPRIFPVRLEFNTASASFEMRPTLLDDAVIGSSPSSSSEDMLQSSDDPVDSSPEEAIASGVHTTQP